ncbi:hypothetical protein C2G38_2181995 [Gigaspora rosea]|uniref:Uncharacterized protein n=1 Tax=Gigaspora rosea TaxID=44941 RepID=A0A397VAD2_9GLOM|nr:hypothetical protein C2G38_2181995 [Gigaspora rosea]
MTSFGNYNDTDILQQYRLFENSFLIYLLDNGDKPLHNLKKPAINCEARIKIAWLVASNTVRIERVNNTPNYSHSIEECDMRKRSKFIKDIVGNKTIKDYKPPMIVNVIRKEVSKVCEDSGMEYLKTKEVTNIKQKLVGPISSHLVGDADLKSDISNAIEFL